MVIIIISLLIFFHNIIVVYSMALSSMCTSDSTSSGRVDYPAINYSVPKLHHCPFKTRSDGTVMKTVPKLIRRVFPLSSCEDAVVSGIPICRFPGRHKLFVSNTQNHYWCFPIGKIVFWLWWPITTDRSCVYIHTTRHLVLWLWSNVITKTVKDLSIVFLNW